MRSPHTPAYRVFVARLVAGRRSAGLSQGEAAKLLRMPQSRLSRMESGERRVDVIELAEMAELYGQPLTFFVPRRRR